MYVKELIINKFRSIENLNIKFNKGLNIVIGENNAGKSTLIDALRICLGYGNYNTDISIRNEEDFFIDVTNPGSSYDPIEFELRFEVESTTDRQLFNSLMWQNPDDPTNVELRMNFRYSLIPNQSGHLILHRNIWGGGIEGTTIDINELQQVFYTYLEPLRNAEYELRPYSKRNKITSLYREMTNYKAHDAEGNELLKTLDDNHKSELAQKLENVVNGPEWSGLIQSGESFINDHLTKADIKNKHSKVKIGLLEYKYDNIVKGVLTKKQVFSDDVLNGAYDKQRYFDISQNGLGENNLIFASAVLGDIENRRSSEKEHFYALLIEEPEAHLHPHRQNTFFNHLDSLKDFGVQIFMTSHSPTITAKTSLDSLHVLMKQQNRIHGFSMVHSELSPDNKRYLNKFLDVTKSQLFFANGVILVEGISEQLLLPVMAQHIGINLDKEGIEVVNIGGVSFEPFAKLFNPDDTDRRLASKCSIITDDDRGLISSNDFRSSENSIDRTLAKLIFSRIRNAGLLDATNRLEEDYNVDSMDFSTVEEVRDFIIDKIAYKASNPSSRAQNAKSLEKNNLNCCLANITFEYELLLAGNNFDLIVELYSSMHPNTDFSDTGETKEIRARDFLVRLDGFKDKSQLANKIAFSIENEQDWKDNFTVPDYIQSAFRFVIS